MYIPRYAPTDSIHTSNIKTLRLIGFGAALVCMLMGCIGCKDHLMVRGVFTLAVSSSVLGG